MQALPGKPVDFGPFRYDPVQRVLFRAGEPVALPPKAVDTLHALVERRGQVVEKADLMRLVWPDCTVEEIGLARNISILRKALGDDAETYIETVPKRGYRFAASSDGRASGSDLHLPHGHRWAVAAVTAALFLLLVGVYWQFYRPSRFVPASGGARVAVVPLECWSADGQVEPWCGMLAETLVEEVSRIKSAQVISPSTVGRYREWRIPIAIMSRLLGLHVVMEGKAVKADGHMRIALRMTDVHSGRLIWAQQYDVPADSPAAQVSIARAAAAEAGRYLAP